MTRAEAVAEVARLLPPGAAVVAATGFIARELQAQAPRDLNFYLIGSMGLAASIGLGVALRAPERTVVVLDGDGAVLMALGGLAMVGAARPRRFIHVVLDNRGYASTGNQPSLSGTVSLTGVARACGYSLCEEAAGTGALREAWRRAVAAEGPALLAVRIDLAADDKPPPRIACAPEDHARRFHRALVV